MYSITMLAAKLLILSPPGELGKLERRQALNGMEATMDALVLYDNLVFGLFAASREKRWENLLYSSVGLFFALGKIVRISHDLLSKD